MDRISISQEMSFSKIIFGMWRLTDDPDISPSHIHKKIEACLEQDITTIDQADIYGGYTSEEVFGIALKQSRVRDRLEIITKCGIIAPIGKYHDARVKYYDTSRTHIIQSVEQSLRLMNIDYIDLLLIHRPNPLMDAEDTGSALDDLMQSGKVKSVGTSNFKPHDFRLLQSSMHQKLTTNQIEISVMANDCFTNGDVAYFQEKKLPIMAWSPLSGGRLFDGDNKKLLSVLQDKADENNTTPTAIAVAWLLSHPAKIMPIMGTNSLPRIQSISMACKVKLDTQSWFEIFEAANGHDVP